MTEFVQYICETVLKIGVKIPTLVKKITFI